MKTTFTNIFAFLFCFAFHFHLSAQDPHFSQPYAAPLQVNPALNGLFSGGVRIIGNYRNQWSSILSQQAFQTSAVSVDWRKPATKRNYFGLSLQGLHDQAGTARFSQNRFGAGVSFLKHLDGNGYNSSYQYLIGGIQAGLGQNRFDHNSLWFSPQFNTQTGEIDRQVASGEQIEMMATPMFMDLNAGIMWYTVWEDNLSLYAGAAMFHINRPDISFLDSGPFSLDRRWVGQLGGEFPLTKQLSFLPNVIFMSQGTSRMTFAGGNFRYTNKDWREVALRAGAWARIVNSTTGTPAADAVAVTAFLEMESVFLGLSYDLTTSKLSPSNGSRGSFEVSLTYILQSQVKSKVKCPHL